MKIPQRLPSKLRRLKGFSLLEILIGMSLGLMLLAGVFNIWMGSHNNYLMVEELSKMQEGARFVFTLLEKDIKNAGNLPCPQNHLNFNSTVQATQNAQWLSTANKGIGVVGYTSATANFLNQIARNSDLIVIHKLNTEERALVKSQLQTYPEITTQSNHVFDQGNILTIISPNCEQTSEFMMTNAIDQSIPNRNKIVHDKNLSANGLKNCTELLGGNSVGCKNSSQFYPFAPNSLIYPNEAIVYYLRDQSLFRKISTHNSDEVLHGIENLVFFYGIDTDDDKVPNKYLRSLDVLEWDKVVTIKIYLLMISQANVLNKNTSITYATFTTPADKKIRKYFTKTIKIRHLE